VKLRVWRDIQFKELRIYEGYALSISAEEMEFKNSKIETEEETP